MGKVFKILLIFFFFILSGHAFAQKRETKVELVEKNLAASKHELASLSVSDNWERMSVLYADIAHMNDFLGKYDEAIINYYQAIIIADQNSGLGSEFGISSPWLVIDLGNVFYKIKSNDKAIELYRLAFNFFCQNSDNDGMITSLNNIGLCYNNKGNPQKAISFFNSAKSIGELFKNNHYIIALCDLYIGDALSKMKRHVEAINSYKGAIQYYHSTKDTAIMSFALLRMATSYFDNGKPDSAVFYFRQIKELLANIMQNPVFGQAVAAESKALFEMGHTDAALDTALKYLFTSENFAVNYVLAMSINHDSAKNAPTGKVLILDNVSRLSMYNTIYQCYKKLGNDNKALYFHELYAGLNDTVQSANLSSATQNLEYSIRSAKLIDKIQLLEERENWLKMDRNYVRNLSYYLLFAALMLLVVFISNRRRFNYRYQMLVEFFEGLFVGQKVLLFFILGLYSVLFFYFFRPAIAEIQVNQYLFLPAAILPGIYVFFALVVSFTLMASIGNLAFLRIGKHNKSYLSFLLSFVIAFALQVFHYRLLIHETPTESYLLSISLLLLASFILPFNIVIIIIENFVLKKIIEHASSMSNELKDVKPMKKGAGLIMFKSLRTSDYLELDPANLIGVQAQGNYSQFYYMKDGKAVKAMVLLPIKKTELAIESCNRIVRCHNSYIVNIDYITKVNGNSRGYRLSMRHIEESFMVSRSRQSMLMEKIQSVSEKK